MFALFVKIHACVQPRRICGLVSWYLLQGGDTIGEAARALIEDVQEAIFDLVELIKTYHSKSKLSKLLTSTLFKRRHEELDTVVDRAIMRLQVSEVHCFVWFRSRHCAAIERSVLGSGYLCKTVVFHLHRIALSLNTNVISRFVALQAVQRRPSFARRWL